MTVEVRAMAEDDRYAAFNIARHAFGQPPVSEAEAAGLPIAERLVATEDGRLVGMLRLLPWSQFFGGAAVSSAGIAAVAVAQEARGHGIGSALVREAISELERRDIALVTLNFSGMAPYRKAGFEIAGARYTRAVPVPSACQGVEHIAPDDPAIKQCYRALLPHANGLVDRPDWLWEMVLGSAPQLAAFAVRGEQGLRGYLLYATEPDGNAHLPFEYAPGDDEVARKLAVRDFVWLDGEAAVLLLGCAARDRAFATDLFWPSGADEPRSLSSSVRRFAFRI